MNYEEVAELLEKSIHHRGNRQNLYYNDELFLEYWNTYSELGLELYACDNMGVWEYLAKTDNAMIKVSSFGLIESKNPEAISETLTLLRLML